MSVRCDSFNMKQPCANCPFRKEGAIELTPGRLKDIVEDLKRDDYSIFVCHKTLDAKETAACMGALAYQWHYGKLPVMARLGLSGKQFTIADLDALQDVIVDKL